MRFRTKFKIFLSVCLVAGALVCFVSFNSFGIDADTIYSLQGDMTAFQYDRARGYKYSGNEMYGIFQNIEEEKIQEDTDGSASDDTTADNTYRGSTVYDTTPISDALGIPQPLYKQSDPAWGSIEYYPGHTIGDAGCFPTSLAMIVSHLNGTSVTPDVVVSWIQSNVPNYYTSAGSSYNIISPVCNNWGLTASGQISISKSAIQECLDNGGALLFRASSGWWTGGGHGMAILGYAEDRDHIRVNNPSNSGGGHGNPAGNGSGYSDNYSFSIDDVVSSSGATLCWQIYKTGG